MMTSRSSTEIASSFEGATPLALADEHASPPELMSLLVGGRGPKLL
jgi:hypothetical protein